MDKKQAWTALRDSIQEIQARSHEDHVDVDLATMPCADLPGFDSLRLVEVEAQVAARLGMKRPFREQLQSGRIHELTLRDLLESILSTNTGAGNGGK